MPQLQRNEERLLMRINPKLAEMADKELGPDTDGHLFGDRCIKVISSYIQTFFSMDKVQQNLRKMFAPLVFGRTSRVKAHSPGLQQPQSFCRPFF